MVPIFNHIQHYKDAMMGSLKEISFLRFGLLVGLIPTVVALQYGRGAAARCVHQDMFPSAWNTKYRIKAKLHGDEGQTLHGVPCDFGAYNLVFLLQSGPELV